MSGIPVVFEADLEKLYSPDDQEYIASLLKVRSIQGRCKLKKELFHIAQLYDLDLIETTRRPAYSDTIKSLKMVKKLVRKLALAIGDSNFHAQGEIAQALSKTRKDRKLSTGEDVLPYGHVFSNEWIFDKESRNSFYAELFSIHDHLSTHIEKLSRGGRPREPGQFAVEKLEKLWINYLHRSPTIGNGSKKGTGNFVELCNLVLGPIAKRRGKEANFASAAQKVLYGKPPT